MRSIILLLLASLAWAGGGPETTLVVVNARSPMSRRVANEYVKLRDIPQSHVVYLEHIPHLGVVPLDFFLQKIWKPVRLRLDKVGPIDLITYSADFPYGVRFQVPDGLNKQERMIIGGVAALNGLTYLIEQVEAGEAFHDLAVNPWYRIKVPSAKRRRATAEERGHAMRANQAMQAKDYRAAAEAFSRLVATYKHSQQAWYNYACCLARLRKGDEAMKALRAALQNGWRNLQHTQGDPDLASLRSRPDFIALLESMQGGAQFEVLASEAFSLEGHYLSTHLAYTGPKGNSLSEILGYLRRSAQSDGTRPGGTVYICENNDVRSRSRAPFFPKLVSLLEQRGRKVELLRGVLPPLKNDVIGAVVGKAGFDWAKSKSRMLPGAIAEHLTSHGANFGTPGQTKLTEFLRGGAAGASGTVMEPLAIHQKFPNPMIHVFYADGCSLAEAFYQSVGGPYQLMIVGDGLARPFAEFQKVRVQAPPVPWKGTVELKAEAAGAERFELWVDGRRMESLSLDTTALDDGHHDVRVVAVSGPVGTRSYERVEAVVSNHGRSAQIASRTPPTVHLRQEIEVEIKASGAVEFQLWQGSRLLRSGKAGRLGFGAIECGPGPFWVVPRVVFADGKAWRGKPLPFDGSGTSSVFPAIQQPKNTLPGLVGEVDGRAVLVSNLGDRRSGPKLADQLEVKQAKKVVLKGWFEAPRTGFFQLVVNGAGQLAIKRVCERTPLEGQVYLPLALAQGWHRLEIEFEPQGAPRLEIMLGGDQVLVPLKLRHETRPPLKKQPSVSGDLEAGLLLTWKTAVRNIASIAVEFKKGAASAWVVETGSGRRWKAVKQVTVVGAAGFAELTFPKPLRARRLRLRAQGDAEIAKVSVLSK